jgi:hypothetical protein
MFPRFKRKLVVLKWERQSALCTEIIFLCRLKAVVSKDQIL